jgi:SNF2 family DNA or RNA helicase
MPTLKNDEIRPGVMVRHAKQPSKVGALTGNTLPGLCLMVEVRWGTHTIYEPAAVLELFDFAEEATFENLIGNQRYERIESLRSLMTFEKLSGSLSNVFYSMRTAEIRFFAHQFVPVLKFVNSTLSRLLIADEVGLGKTIEAGLIWTECRARYRARRLLVVCPPTLIPKWIRELQDRFDIDATYADAKGLLERFNRFKSQGPAQSFALVTSYNALRPIRNERKQLEPWLRFHGSDVRFSGNDDIADWNPRPALLRSLLEWDERPFIDLVVFDEAHLMKNTATANHLIGDVLATCAQSVLGLSATPLTTTTRDLYSLLRLIDPDMFEAESTFNAMCRRNRPSVFLARELSQPQIDRNACLELLREIEDSAAKRNLQVSLESLRNDAKLDEEAKIELLNKAGRLNELGAFLTRTRKVEITERKATRKAVTLDVHPTQEELVFYNSVLRLIRQHVKSRGDNLSLFHLIGPALAMTSCLPVMAARLRSGRARWGDLDDLVDLQDAFAAEADEDDSTTAFVGEDYETLLGDRSWLPEYDFETHDTKFNALKDELLKRRTDEKVIIFAFFKDTLEYLRRRLEAAGITCLMVTGDVKDRNARDELLRQFSDTSHRVLLCSEVAAEGVDLQFCRVIVNYDLPWNPMRVEQRIGRIDRIGQKADSIVIINFHVRGTIDGSIYEHLYSKIGIFQDTVGDLEGIMGRHVNSLAKGLLADQLTPAQTAERVRLAAEAIARERQTMAEIDQESDTLLGLRSYLQSNVRSGDSLGRFIKPAELRLFTTEFFKESYTGNDACQLNWDTPLENCLKLNLSFRAFSDFEEFLEKQNHPLPRGFLRANRLVTLTFDPAVREQHHQRYRSLVLTNHLHPFVGWMTSTYENREKRWHPASAVRLRTTTSLEGEFFYLIARVVLKHSALARDELLFRAQRINDGETLSPIDSEALINEALDAGESWVPSAGFPACSVALQRVWETLSRDCQVVQTSFGEELELRVNSKRAQVRAHFGQRIRSAEKRLQTMQLSREGRDRGVRVTQSQIQHLRERLAEELEKLDLNQDPESKFWRVSCGIIKVTRMP